MTRDEHKNIVNQLLSMATPEQQANASNLLTQLTDDYEQTLTNSENLATQNATLTQNNETLREVNAKLFLRVGHTDPNPKEDPKNPPNDQLDKNQLTFDKLFNEKGELI